MRLTTRQKSILLPVLLPMARAALRVALAIRWVMRPDLRQKS